MLGGREREIERDIIKEEKWRESGVACRNMCVFVWSGGGGEGLIFDISVMRNPARTFLPHNRSRYVKCNV
jgi:hypothetical protein